jgi:nucleotide-binding universal stress UspA family protein
MKQYRNLLFVIEPGNPDQQAALARALSLAEQNQAELTVLSIVERPRLGPFFNQGRVADIEQSVRAHEQARIDSLLAACAPKTPIPSDVRFGKTFLEAIRDVLRNGRDLVIKQAEDPRLGRLLFGGTDLHLLRKCPCPVWIMRPGEQPKYRRVVAAIDFDPWETGDIEGGLNRQILDLAAGVALADLAELHLVHAWEPVADSVVRVFDSELSESEILRGTAEERTAHQARLEREAARLVERLGADTEGYLAPQPHLRQGNPRHVIPELVKDLDADLVVMGTLSRSGIPGLLIGNTAEAILDRLGCSVVTMKPAGFESPVKLEV